MNASPDIAPSSGPPPCIVGVIADTHIPDRVNALHPELLERLQEAGVQHILHAGDISSPRVLHMLREIAPVTAVRGNRDFFAGRLAMQEQITLGGVEIALMHGHHGLLSYLSDKWMFWRDGYRLERYIDSLVAQSGPARVVIFGHTHHPEIILHEGKMLFNPGSASFGSRRGRPPSIGFLRIYPSGRIEARITPMKGYVVRQREWLKKKR